MVKKVGFYLQDIDAKYEHDNEVLFMELDMAEEWDRPEIEEKILLNNIPFIHHILHRHFRTVFTTGYHRLSYDDLFSASVFGLYKAIGTFDVSKGFKFATYCFRTISNEVNMELRRSRNMPITDSTEKEVYSDGEGEGLTLEDMLSYEEESYEDLEMVEITIDMVERAKELLSDKEHRVWTLSMAGLNQREISVEAGMSQSYASRLRTSAIRKLRLEYNKMVS